MRRGAVTLACAYEIFAAVTGKTPTITDICRKHRWAAVLLLLILVVHLRRMREDAFVTSILEDS